MEVLRCVIIAVSLSIMNINALDMDAPAPVENVYNVHERMTARLLKIFAFLVPPVHDSIFEMIP